MGNNPVKWLTVTIFFLSMVNAWPQNSYRVFSVEGNVYMKSDPPQRIKKRTELRLTDLVVIESSSVLRIVVYPSGAIYTAEVPGTFRIKEILDSGRGQSANYVKAVNGQIASEKKKSGDFRSRVIGASSRGNNSDDCLNEIAASILDAVNADNTPQVEKVKQKKLFHLRIVNPGGSAIPVAVFCMSDKSERVEALYKEPVWVEGSALDLPQAVFSADSECEFFAAAVDESIYLPDLARALQTILWEKH